MSPLVYSEATHKRFEHSLGVMELAGRVFDVVTNPANVTDEIRDLIKDISHTGNLSYWRRVVRMAALCHDIGHLPFSHAAEKELLPAGNSHEDISRALILSDEMKDIWNSMTGPLRPEDVAKLALGPKEEKELGFSTWEAILSEIIVGDAFGVDRIDYLLRDAHHCGVPYGKFDHYRLIDTLRILPASPAGDEIEGGEPTLGVEHGGIHTAEALLLARYFMYSQVYFHPVRRIYDTHLKDFLVEWLPGGRFSTDIEKHLSLTDNEVWSAILNVARTADAVEHVHAKRIVERDHFKRLYSRDPSDVSVTLNPGQRIFEAAKQEFGEESVRYDSYSQKSDPKEFPVRMGDWRIASSTSISETLQRLPVAKFEYVYVDAKVENRAKTWLKKNRQAILEQDSEDEG